MKLGRRRYAGRWLASSAVLLVVAVAGGPAAQEIGLGETSATAGEPGETIAAQAPDDAVIAARLREIYENVDGLAGVGLRVDGGVVELEGVVDSTSLIERAESLARRVDGVVEVQNAMTVNRAVEPRLRRAVEKLRAQLLDLVAVLPLLALALAIVLLAWVAGRLVAGRERLFERMTPNPFIRSLAQQLVKGLIVIAGLVVALNVLDAGALLGSVAGALGLVGLAVGFATRDTVENYIASILLSLRQPFSVNDHVIIEGSEGKVARLTPRATVLISFDGNHVRIPNAKVFKATIVNYTRNPLRRFEFVAGVETGIALAPAQQLATETLRETPGVTPDPEPFCLIDALGDSTVDLRFFGWVDQRSHDFGKVRSAAVRRVKEAFDSAGIAMPEPIYNLNLRSADDAERLPAESSATSEPSKEPPEQPPADDLAPDRTIDEQVVEESARAEEDLLDPQAPKE